MGMISEVIKRYEHEGNQRIAEARQSKQSKQDIFFETGPTDVGSSSAPQLDLSRKDPTAQDFAYFDWQNKLIEFHKLVKQANNVLEELNNSRNVLNELERLRADNADLKDKLRAYEGA